MSATAGNALAGADHNYLAWESFDGANSWTSIGGQTVRSVMPGASGTGCATDGTNVFLWSQGNDYTELAAPNGLGWLLGCVPADGYVFAWEDQGVQLYNV